MDTILRSRYLPALGPAAIARLPDKAWAPVVVPTGAIEQHGPHLPVAVDALMGQVLAALAIRNLPEGANCYVAPAITVGKSNEHTGFPGTLTLSRRTLRASLLAIAEQLKAWDFTSLAVLNTHGGNSAVIFYTLREITQRYGLRTHLLHSTEEIDLPAQERAFGYHANTVETAWMLALMGDRVKMEKARCDYPARIDDPGELRPERAPATVCWVSQDLSPSGIMGDALVATPELGARWLEASGKGYARAIASLCEDAKRSLP